MRPKKAGKYHLEYDDLQDRIYQPAHDEMPETTGGEKGFKKSLKNGIILFRLLKRYSIEGGAGGVIHIATLSTTPSALSLATARSFNYFKHKTIKNLVDTRGTYG